MTREEVLEKVSKKREEFISWYHEFHQIPELGFEEKITRIRTGNYDDYMGI